MKDTGRVKSLLHPTLRRMLFGRRVSGRALRDLELMSLVDRAHVVMLAEQGIIDPSSAARLLGAIERLVTTEFAPLRDREVSRGLYFLYEDYLSSSEGAAIGGLLQTARSRNDLQATILHLKLRRPYRGLLRAALRLVASLARHAERDQDVVMPLYTHGQVAVPGTLGHYYAATAQALLRDIDGMLAIRTALQTSPLGAGPIGGTEFPIDAERTAQLLGFERGPSNAIDAIAARDMILRLLSAMAIFGVTLSRLARDFASWSSSELGFLRFPDQLVGVSSAMPQKRNAFVLEHAIGRSASAFGAFASATLAMHGQPFTNSISVGTESAAFLWKALKRTTDTTVMLRAMVNGAIPDPAAMERRAIEGFAGATSLANRLVREAGFDFRSAHMLVGSCVRDAITSGQPLVDVMTQALARQGTSLALPDEDLGHITRSREFGGGPGPTAFAACEREIAANWRRCYAALQALEERWSKHRATLDNAVRRVHEWS